MAASSIRYVLSSKSRLNFLELLSAGDKTYLIDEAAIQYMRGRGLSNKVVDLLTSHKQQRFTDREAWEALAEDDELLPDPQWSGVWRSMDGGENWQFRSDSHVSPWS